MKQVLCLTNVDLESMGGRAEAIKNRVKIIEQNGWRVTIFPIKEPYNHIKLIQKLIEIYKRIKRDGYDVLWSMNSPYFLHVYAFLIKNYTKYNGKWLAEFRDPLYTNPDYKNRSKLEMLLHKTLERKVVETADKIVWAEGTQMESNYFLKNYPSTDRSKFKKLPFRGYKKSDFMVEPKVFDKFTITYAGKFYKNWLEPLNFLIAFAKFVDEYNLRDKDIQLLFYGDWSAEYDYLIEELKIDSYILRAGWIGRKQLIPILKGSDLLLYIGGDTKINKLNISQKIWDYIGAERPILVLSGCDFKIKEFVEKNSLGFSAPYRDINEIKNKLGDVWDLYLNKELKISGRKRFEREGNDMEFINTLQDLIKG